MAGRVIPLGPIVRLQVQRSGLKTGPRGRRTYDPAPIQPVPSAYISEDGMEGVSDEGYLVQDVHHADAPSSKHQDGINGVSMLFTSHYATMRERFGRHMMDGVAGESILVATDRRVSLDDLQGGLAIEGADGTLEVTQTAEPCVEFTRFALQRPADENADPIFLDALEFLRGGRRGFYMRWIGPRTLIRPGQSVILRRG